MTATARTSSTFFTRTRNILVRVGLTIGKLVVVSKRILIILNGMIRMNAGNINSRALVGASCDRRKINWQSLDAIDQETRSSRLNGNACVQKFPSFLQIIISNDNNLKSRTC